jgi:hypothetical protein
MAKKKVKVVATVPPASTALAVPKIAKGAISKDVGPLAIATLAKIGRDETAAKQVLLAVTQKTYDIQSRLTLAIVKAAKVDGSIVLANVFSDDTKARNHLFNQVGIALGYREIFEVNGKQTVSYAASVKQYFPNAADQDKESPEAKAKATFRTNWVHRITQCVQVAQGIIERKMDAAIDKASGTLRLAGPEVKKQFGAPSVLLNERQSVTTGDTTVKLKAKPSFTAIASAAGAAHGHAVRTGSNNRAAKIVANPAAAIEQMAGPFVACVQKLDAAKITGATKAALESVYNAIDKVL